MNILIIGAGGHGREMAQLASRMKSMHVKGFIDDNSALVGQHINGLKVLGDSDWVAKNHKKFAFVCALGDPATRRKAVNRFDKIGVKWATLIDPDCNVPDDAVVGEGSMLCAGTMMTTNIRLGRHTIVNMGCTLSHDLKAGDFATLACGIHLSGNVTIGEGAEIGVGSNVIQGITIG